MKVGIKELIFGLLLLFAGGYLTYTYLPKVIEVLLGIIGPMLLFMGFLIAWIGYEDIREGI